MVKFLALMRFFSREKTWLAVLGVLALVAIAVLASGLRDVSFRPGQIMQQQEAQTASLPIARLAQDLAGIPLWKQLVAWAIIFLLVVIGSLILSPELRRRVIRSFLRFTVVLAALYFLIKNYGYLFNWLNVFGSQPAQLPLDGESAGPVPVFQPPQMSPLLVFLISVGVAAAVALLVWAIYRWWRRQQALFAMRRPLDDLADIARQSLQKLSRGGAWDDVIEESYVRMSGVVGVRRGLIRHDAMTPSEFAVRLEKAGLPREAIHNLTSLFERVRYGGHRSTHEDISAAVACLNAILHACGETP